MKPFSSTSERKESLEAKLYSRPCCSPARGCLVVSASSFATRQFTGSNLYVVAASSEEVRYCTGNGKAEGVGVVGEEALEDGGFARARGAGDDDGSVDLGG